MILSRFGFLCTEHFDESQLSHSNSSMAKIYTRSGDKGTTSLVGGTRVPKTDPRLDAYGTVDELNSTLGLCAAQLHIESLSSNPKNSAYLKEIRSQLIQLQNHLFFIGSRLAAEDENIRQQLPPLPDNAIRDLENQIDLWSQSLVPLKEFILPGGSLPASQLHIARCVCRRAERAVADLPWTQNSSDLQFLNRLSDYLFTAARFANWCLETPDQVWKKT